MARARNIKPAFFKNEVLAQLEPLARLLFAGLWCLADREGRLEDRPLRIKAELFPYEPSCDVAALLDLLCSTGFVRRYSVGSGNYIEVMNFVKHQRPHPKEAKSELPAPELTTELPGKNTASSGDSGTEQPSTSPSLTPLLPPSSSNGAYGNGDIHVSRRSGKDYRTGTDGFLKGNS